jgi:DNA mismatch repair ATPase MutS
MIAIVTFHLNTFVKATFIDLTDMFCRISVYHCIGIMDDVQILRLIYRHSTNVIVVIDGCEDVKYASSPDSLLRFSGKLGCRCFHVKYWTNFENTCTYKKEANFGGPAMEILRRLLKFAPICKFKDVAPALLSALCIKNFTRLLKNSATAPALWNFGQIRQSFGVSLFYSRKQSIISDLRLQVDNSDAALAGTYFDTLQSMRTECSVSTPQAKKSIENLQTLARLQAFNTSTTRSIIRHSLCALASRPSIFYLLENVHTPLAVGIKMNMNTPQFSRVSSVVNLYMSTNTTMMKQGFVPHSALGIFAWNSGRSQILDMCRYALCTIAKLIFTMISQKHSEVGVKSKVLLYKRTRGFFWFVQETDIDGVHAYNAMVNRQSTHTYRSNDVICIRILAQRYVRGKVYNRLTFAELDCLNMRFEAVMNRASYISRELCADLCERLKYLKRYVCDSVLALKCVCGMIRWSKPIEAEQMKLCRPTLNESEALILVNTKPDVPMSQTLSHFTISLSRLVPFELIMGANMSGQTALIHSVFQTVIHALSGCFVNSSHATCPSLEICSNHSVQKGLFISHFFDECMNLSRTVFMANTNSLIFLHEPCTSTSTNENEYVLWAVLEFLLRRRTKIVVSSHLKILRYFTAIYISPRLSRISTGYKYIDEKHAYLHDEHKNYGFSQACLSKLPLQIISNAVKISLQMTTDFRERDNLKFKLKRDQNKVVQNAQLILYYLKSINTDHRLCRRELRRTFLKI